MITDDNNDDLPDLSNRELLRVLMQEIVDVRNELRQEFKEGIATLDQKFTGSFDRLSQEIVETKKELKSDIHILRLEVHQNQVAFMANHDSLEKRVTVLEMAA